MILRLFPDPIKIYIFNSIIPKTRPLKGNATLKEMAQTVQFIQCEMLYI